VFELYLSSARTDARAKDVVHLAESQNVRLIQAEADRLDGMVGTRRHQGVNARRRAQSRLKLPTCSKSSTRTRWILVLDGVQDPHNLGACLRVADAAGAHAVVAPKDRASASTRPRQSRHSGGADSVPYITVTNLARALREMQEAASGSWARPAKPRSRCTRSTRRGRLPGCSAEGDGLPGSRAKPATSSRKFDLGTVESLNVSVASGVCLFEARRQRGG